MFFSMTSVYLSVLCGEERAFALDFDLANGQVLSANGLGVLLFPPLTPFLRVEKGFAVVFLSLPTRSLFLSNSRCEAGY